VELSGRIDVRELNQSNGRGAAKVKKPGGKWFKDRGKEFFWAVVAAVAVESALGLLPPAAKEALRVTNDASKMSVAYVQPEWIAFIDDVKNGEFDA
jgi:hypothetical protein